MTLRHAPLFAGALLKQLDVRDVPDVRHVAGALHLDVEEAETRSFEGALVRIKGSAEGIIVVRRSIREAGRKNFTIAHELGHLLLPGHGAAVCREHEVENWDKNQEPQELEANQFAGELLLPTHLLRSRVASDRPALHFIEAIAGQFSTSLTATAYRFVELTSHACAMVWSETGIAKWCRRSEEFRNWIRLGERLDERTFAFDSFRDLATPGRPERVPAVAWLEGEVPEGATIYEDTRHMPYYGAALTLLWIPEPFEGTTTGDSDGDEGLDPEEFSLRRKVWPGRR